MSITLLATKLHIPHLQPERVARPRLVDRLNEGMARKLTLVSTPAGFGKTTLLSEWAAQCQHRIAWLSLDEGDNDPARFLAHLFAALQTVHPSLAGQPGEADLSLVERLTGLINRISALEEQFALVLDDYHLIEADVLHRLLAFWLDHLPEKMHLVIASRADPPLPVARLRAQGQLVELRQGDLRFTPAETAEFLSRLMGAPLGADAAQTLAARTEGWAAGLQMAAVSMQGRDPEQIQRFIQSFSGGSHFVLDYLAEEVLQRQPPHVQAFLLETSVLDRLSGPLCDAVLRPEGETTSPPSAILLDQLEHANLFILPLDDEQRWYRYHQLFADLLRSRLQQTRPERLPVLRSRASAWHEQNGLMTEAINYALAAEDFERAVRLIAQTAEATFMRSELMTLLGWMEKLPDKLIQSRPSLCLYHAWALLFNGYPLETVEARLRSAEGGDFGRPTVNTMPLRAFLALYQGQTLQAIQLSGQALEQLPESEAVLRGLASLTLGVAQLTEGDSEAGQRTLGEAARLGHRTGNLMVAGGVLCNLAELSRKQGQLHKAQQLYQQALERATDASGRRWPIAGRALLGLGELAREWNDFEAAARFLTDGIELVAQWGQVGALGGYLSLARLRQAQGDFAGAGEALEKARQLALRTQTTDLDDLIVEMYAAWLSMAQGNLNAARKWAQWRGFDRAADTTELDRREDFVTYHLRKYEYPVLARLWLAEGRPAEAQALLEQLVPNVEKLDRVGLAIEARLLLALALKAQGHVEETWRAVEQALILAQPEGFIRLFVDEGESVRRLISDSRSTIEKACPDLKGYIDQLLAAFALPAGSEPGPTPPPQAQNLEADQQAWPLSERELEVLRLLATPLSAGEMAAQLCVALSTVRSHVKSIYSKLDVSNRLEAIQRAKELGLL